MKEKINKTIHIPVLFKETLEGLDIQRNDIVVDGTLGGAGHSHAIAEKLSESGTLIAFDLEQNAIERAKDTLEDTLPKKIFINKNFRTLIESLQEVDIDKVDAFLFDLGWSSDQLETSGRGFTFLKDEPLSMTLSDTSKTDLLTAEEIVNYWEEENIADIIYGWGGEQFSRRIAKAIVETRKETPITTTVQLAELIKEAVPVWYAKRKIHPATKTFQALRIAVNDELGALKELLEQIQSVAKPGARIAIISFHSLEDRIVKNTFRSWKQAGIGAATTKKPIIASREELKENPRARSAKLRVFNFNN